MGVEQFEISLIVAIYMVALMVIGFFAERRTKSVETFFLANRSLGSWVTAISSTAASESGWVVLGAVGLAYKDGVSALWFAPGCLFGYWINLYWLAPRLRREAERTGALTIPDLLATRYGDPLRLIRGIGFVVIFLSLGGYVAAQMTATGKAMEAILSVSYAQGILIGGAIIVAYTFLGGFLAVSWTDFLQGLVMVFALALMPILAVQAAGGYSATLGKVAAEGAGLVSITGGKSGYALFGTLVGLFGIGLGYPGQPHVVTRYMAAQSDEKIRRSAVIAMVWGVIVFFGAGFLGLAGRVLMPRLGQPGGDPEQLFPLLSKQMLHPLLAGVMLAAILSAIMSTVSSQLLVVASAVSRDLLHGIFRVRQEARGAVWGARAAVLVLGVAGLLVALSDVRVVFWFVLFAWSGLGAAFGPVLLLALTTDKLTRAGVVAGMATGFVVTVVWKLGGLSDYVYELVPAFFLAGAAALIASAVERRSRAGAAAAARPAAAE